MLSSFFYMMGEAVFIQASAASPHPSPMIRFNIEIHYPQSLLSSPQAQPQLVTSSFGILETAAPLPPFIVGISHLQTPIMLYSNATAHGLIYLQISSATLNRLEELRSRQTDSRH